MDPKLGVETSVAERSAVPNLQRGMSILEFLATGQRSATITELSERLGYPSASVYRITHELAELGYLSRNPATKRFALTNKFLLLGQPQARDRGLVESVLPAMRGLRKATSETTQLCCLVETENVVLEQLLSTHPFKYSADLGARCPAYSCAPGKAIIAYLPGDDRDELVSSLKLKRFTPNTIVSRRELRRQMMEIAESGFAVDRAEGMEGIHCVAAAICDRNGFPVAALTIAAPAARILERDFPRLGKVVMEAATKAQQSYAA